MTCRDIAYLKTNKKNIIMIGLVNLKVVNKSISIKV